MNSKTIESDTPFFDEPCVNMYEEEDEYDTLPVPLAMECCSFTNELTGDPSKIIGIWIYFPDSYEVTERVRCEVPCVFQGGYAGYMSVNIFERDVQNFKDACVKHGIEVIGFEDDLNAIEG